jgi:hypothetical protein
MDGEDSRKCDAVTTSPMQDGPITDRARQRCSLIRSDSARPDRTFQRSRHAHLNRRPLRLSTMQTKLSSPAIHNGRRMAGGACSTLFELLLRPDRWPAFLRAVDAPRTIFIIVEDRRVKTFGCHYFGNSTCDVFVRDIDREFNDHGLEWIQLAGGRDTALIANLAPTATDSSSPLAGGGLPVKLQLRQL